MKTIILALGILLLFITNVYSQIWSTKGNTVFLTDSTKKVGVGTSKPTTKLDVKGKVRITDTLYVQKVMRVDDKPTDQIVTLASDYSQKVGIRLIRPTSNNHDWEIINNNDGYLRINTSANDFETIEDSVITVSFADNGRVGIKTRDPAYSLDVNGSIRVMNGGIGVRTNISSSYPFQVNGAIRAKEVVVQTGWSDYVFNKGYKLLSLLEVENYINQNKHLPDVPSAKEIETNGVKLGQMDSILIKKIEELTLYILQLNDKVSQKEKQVDELQKLTVHLQEQIADLKSSLIK